MICTLCGLDKVPGNFVWKTNGTVARGQKCRTCLKKTIYDTPEYKNSQRNANYERTYGITLEEYDRLSLKQNHKCAVCLEASDAKGKNSKLQVDHNHKDGKIRGLLCYRCNLAIGVLDENRERIFKILEYLDFYTLGTTEKEK